MSSNEALAQQLLRDLQPVELEEAAAEVVGAAPTNETAEHQVAIEEFPKQLAEGIVDVLEMPLQLARLAHTSTSTHV